jgi:hypothetical protein
MNAQRSRSLCSTSHTSHCANLTVQRPSISLRRCSHGAPPILNQWLVSRVGEEVSPKQTLTRFQHYVEYEADSPMVSLLPLINQQASLYRRMVERAADGHADLDPVGLSVYRLQAMDLELLKPVLIWLHEPGRRYPSEVAAEVVRACES